jgi:hypothetical protein
LVREGSGGQRHKPLDKICAVIICSGHCGGERPFGVTDGQCQLSSDGVEAIEQQIAPIAGQLLGTNEVGVGLPPPALAYSQQSRGQPGDQVTPWPGRRSQRHPQPPDASPPVPEQNQPERLIGR